MEFNDHSFFVKEIKTRGEDFSRKFVLVQTPLGHFGYVSDCGDFKTRRYMKVPQNELHNQYSLFENGGFRTYTARENESKQAIIDLIRIPVSFPHIPSIALGEQIKYIEKRFKHRLWVR